jgi:two-component system, NtrC family, sensor histidine kinase HupT/HoxJ
MSRARTTGPKAAGGRDGAPDGGDWRGACEIAQRELEETRRFVTSVLECMTDALFVCDADGRMQRVNTAVEDLTGRSGDELRGEPVQGLVVERSLDLFTTVVDHLRDHPFYDCEISLTARNGEAAPFSMNFTAHYDAGGELVGMILIGRPVGELERAYRALKTAHDDLKQAQLQLVQSAKMVSLGRLVAGVAHELNNPISFVFGNVHVLEGYMARISRYLEAVRAGADSDALNDLSQELKIDKMMSDMGSLLDGTLEGAGRVRDIVQDLKRFSSAKKGRSTRFDLGKVAITAVEWVTKVARRKPRVTLHLPDALEVNGHEGQIHQVLVNLVQNALDAMDGIVDAELEVSGGRGEDKVWVSVRDNGPGIPEDQLLQLFDPFYTTKPVGRGTGLGLYISYGIVVDHKGTLTAGNHRTGAVFTLELPGA